jgi:hypothetical protein
VYFQMLAFLLWYLVVINRNPCFETYESIVVGIVIFTNNNGDLGQATWGLHINIALAFDSTRIHRHVTHFQLVL